MECNGNETLSKKTKKTAKNKNGNWLLCSKLFLFLYEKLTSTNDKQSHSSSLLNSRLRIGIFVSTDGLFTGIKQVQWWNRSLLHLPFNLWTKISDLGKNTFGSIKFDFNGIMQHLRTLHKVN